MRLILLVAGVFVALAGAAAAQPYDTPEALLEAFYEPYFNDQFAEDDSVFRSAALQGLYDADAAATPEGEIGAIEFDPYVDGQDYEITDLEIGTPQIDGDYALVEVRFDNFGESRALDYDLVLEDGGWKIDDVTSMTPGNEYQLSQIFADAIGQ